MIGQLFELLQRHAYLLRGDRRYLYYALLKRNLLLTRPQMLELQTRCIHNLVDHAYRETKYYREILDSAGITPDDIRSREDLMKIPALTKSLIRENMDTIRSGDSHGKNMTIATSGGTTGNQAVVYQSPYYIQMSRAAALRNNLLAGWMPQDKAVWIWGAHHDPAPLKDTLVAKIGTAVNRRLVLNAFRCTMDDFECWAKRIGEFKPKVLYGYPSIILEFGQYLQRKGLCFRSIKRVVTTSEVLKKRDVISEAFECPVYDQYGSREIIAMGIESEKEVMRIADDVVAINVSSEGHFLITALHSYGFPLINYQIGDCGQIEDTSGNGSTDPIPLTKAKLTIGRATENFITSKKQVFSGLLVAGYIGMYDLAILDQQIVQRGYKEFTINYVPDKGLVESRYHEVVNAVLTEYFGEGVEVEFNAVKRIEVEPSGKKIMLKRTFDV
jgi:phenylacetate-CoA ligase